MGVTYLVTEHNAAVPITDFNLLAINFVSLRFLKRFVLDVQ